MSARPTCERCGAILSRYRTADEPDGLCAACAGGSRRTDWRILADHVDVHRAVDKLRRRHGWAVGAVEALPGYRLEAWPHRFTRARR